MIDWLACLLVKSLGGLLCWMPPELAVSIGEQLGSLAYMLQPKRTQIGLINLRAAFDGKLAPAQSRHIIRACYRQLGAVLVELLRLPVINRAYIDRYLTVEGRERFDTAQASGRPIIFLTGHYGNWELSSIAAALHGYPIVALARAQKKLPKLYRLLVSYRESKGCTIVHKGGAMRQLLRALDQGRLVGIVGDQASRQGRFADLFGRPALFATGPFQLAYTKDAILLPVFMHRVHGPYHRLVIDPPIVLSRAAGEEEAIRRGIQQFAQALSRHVEEDPTQWLWMHKRWKHTPARRILVFSDGKLGHVKQSLAVVEAARLQCPQVTHDVIEIRWRSRVHRMLAILWSWWLPHVAALRCLRWTISPETAANLLGRYADLIISCGSSTIPANVLWSAQNRAKSIVLMNPAPIPLRRFNLIIAPRHDRLPRRANVIHTAGAFAAQLSEDFLHDAARRLQAHPKFRKPSTETRLESTMRHPHPVLVVFIGGDTLRYALTPDFAEALMHQVAATAESFDGWFFITTSRRTSPAVERFLAEGVGRSERCRLLLLATQDPINGTMEGLLGAADVAIVTGESISMVSEACASGRRVVVVEPPRRQASHRALTKHQRFLRALAHDGYIHLTSVAELRLTIQHALTDRGPAKQLEQFSLVRDAVGKLL